MTRTLLVALLGVLVSAGQAWAGGPCSGVKGGCGRSTYRSSSRDYSPSIGKSPSTSSSSCSGSVSVKGYTRKDGTHVAAHTRSAPGCGSGGSSSGSASTGSSYRSSARTTARTSTWNGTGSAPDADTKPARLAARVAPRVDLPAKFIVILNSGRKIEAADVSKSDDGYLVHQIHGGTTNYPRKLIKSVERVKVAEPLAHDEPNPFVANPRPPPVQLAEQFPPIADDLPHEATVARVIDGDTIKLRSGETVRLIGIDTPETVHPTKPVEKFGREATIFTRRMLEGKKVRLEYDDANAAIDHRDKYGRLLAYVSVDDVDFNAEIIKQGYAHAYTEFPFRRMQEFTFYEHEARKKEAGLWKPDEPAELEVAPLLQQEAKPSGGGGYWITTSSGVRHNSSCRWYRNSNGRECGPSEGRACKICGG